MTMQSKINQLNTAIMRYQSLLDDYRIAMEEIRDLARTGMAPDAWGMTPDQWNQHKVNKIACLAAKALEEKDAT